MFVCSETIRLLFTPAWNRTRRRLSRRASSALEWHSQMNEQGREWRRTKTWLSSSSQPLKRDNVEAMHRMSRQLATGKGMPKDRKKGIKMQKNAAGVCRHKNTKWRDERHSQRGHGSVLMTWTSLETWPRLQDSTVTHCTLCTCSTQAQKRSPFSSMDATNEHRFHFPTGTNNQT